MQIGLCGNLCSPIAAQKENGCGSKPFIRDALFGIEVAEPGEPALAMAAKVYVVG